MNQHSRDFVGIDTSKLRNAVAVADEGRSLATTASWAPSLIPKKPGDRVKTNRRDAVGLVHRFDEIDHMGEPIAKLRWRGELLGFEG